MLPNMNVLQNVAQVFQEYGVNVPNMKEILYWEFYDYQTIAAAATTSQQFFQVQKGSGGKTYNDTNMGLAGQLSSKQIFLITGIEVEFEPAGPIEDAAAASQVMDDVRDFYKQGWLDVKIGDKSQVIGGPLKRFPPQCSFDGVAAATNGNLAADQAYTYLRATGRRYPVRPMVIPPNMEFSVTINDRLALPSGNAGRGGIILSGYIYRSVQ